MISNHPSSSVPTLNASQYLRAAAAVMVVYHHARDRLPGVFEALPNPVGEAGVDLFFVISGFIMMVTTMARPIGPASFITHRLIRIAPTYWICTAALALFVTLAAGVVNIPVTWPHFLQSMFFIPHSNPSDQSIEPLLAPGWTLDFEMFFYGIFSLSLFLAIRRRLPAMVGMLLGLTVLGQVFRPAGPLLSVYTSPLLLEFAAGAIVGRLYHANRIPRLTTRTGSLAMIAGGAVAIFSATFMLPRPFPDFATSLLRVGTYGFAAVIVVVSALGLERSAIGKNRRTPALMLLGLVGDASYSLYLTHLFSIAVLRIGWLSLGLGTEGIIWALAFVGASLLVSVAVGIASYLALERPLTKTLRAGLDRGFGSAALRAR